jgi:hypothetical protein
MATVIARIFNHRSAWERTVPTKAIMGQRPGGGLCKIAHWFKYGASAAGPIASPPELQNAALSSVESVQYRGGCCRRGGCRR